MEGIGESWDFANSLYAQSPVASSFVFSPLSIAIVLSILHDASKGSTRKQLKDFLFKGSNSDFYQKLNIDRTDNANVKLANGIFVNEQTPLKPEFVHFVRKAYKSRVENHNFSDKSVIQKINDFVNKTTDGHIRSVINEIEPGTLAFVVNALLFKADWASPFSHKSEKMVFSGLLGDREEYSLYRYRLHIEYAEDEQSQFLRILYKNGDFKFNVILPRENVELISLRRSVNQSFLKFMGKAKGITATVQLPKFEFSFDMDVVEYLRTMGITDLFNKECNLSEMTSAEVKISKVLHKATISVHEKGTIASAATIVEMIYMSVDDDTVSFIADRPFLFAVTFKDVPLFMGQYL